MASIHTPAWEGCGDQLNTAVITVNQPLGQSESRGHWFLVSRKETCSSKTSRAHGNCGEVAVSLFLHSWRQQREFLFGVLLEVCPLLNGKWQIRSTADSSQQVCLRIMNSLGVFLGPRQIPSVGWLAPLRPFIPC